MSVTYGDGLCLGYEFYDDYEDCCHCEQGEHEDGVVLELFFFINAFHESSFCSVDLVLIVYMMDSLFASGDRVFFWVVNRLYSD